jgi:hypothetical protein
VHGLENYAVPVVSLRFFVSGGWACNPTCRENLPGFRGINGIIVVSTKGEDDPNARNVTVVLE